MKKVIVTGSQGLIGKEVSRYLKARGYHVIRCDLKLGHDLGNENFVKRWFRENNADYLVNMFGLNDHVDSKKKKTSLFNVSLESFSDYLKTNLTDLFSVCREFARNNKRGAIVTVSSTYGVVAPQPDLYKKNEKHIGYSVSKSGVLQLTRHLAVHLAPDIRVNCIVPGGIRYKQSRKFAYDYSKKTPINRMMDVAELNGIIEYLCSDSSSYMTGSIISIDGGWTAW